MSDDDPAAEMLEGPPVAAQPVSPNPEPIAGQRSPLTLFELCLRTLGKRLKHFYNTRLYPPTAPPLANEFEQALSVYDLAPLVLLEEQRCMERICTAEEAKLKACRDKLKSLALRAPSEQHRLEHVPTYALSPSLDDDSLRPLKSILGLLLPAEFEFRQGNYNTRDGQRLRAREIRWVYGEENRPPEGVSTEAEDPVDAKDDTSGGRRWIKLMRTSVTNVGCGLLADLLANQSKLVELCLQNCQITCAGALLLANALQATTCLRQLDLSNSDGNVFRGHVYDNDIRDVGAAAIGVGLEANRSIVFVSLSNNHVGNRGGSALAKMLRKNISLRHLELKNTSIGRAAEDLVESFARSKTLDTLNMEWCRLRPGLGSQLAVVQAAKAAARETP